MASPNNDCCDDVGRRHITEERDGATHSSDNPVFGTEEPAATVSDREESSSGGPASALTLKEIERAHIERILSETGRNLSKSARILGIDQDDALQQA